MYVHYNDDIADVTYGKGVFWKKVDKTKYHLSASDIKTKFIPRDCVGGIDCRKLPYRRKSFNVVVFDPPYMHTPGGTAHKGHQNFENYYANNEIHTPIIDDKSQSSSKNQPKYHEAVLDLYYRAGKEAWRVLRTNGIYIVKCQDEVCSNQQRLTHIEITNKFSKYGFVVEDLFVVVRNNAPGISRLKSKQHHARKNHSYFMVYRKPKRSVLKRVKSSTTQRKSQKMA